MSNYLVNCEYVKDRQADYTRRNQLLTLFEVDLSQSFADGSSGNVAGELVIDRHTLRSKFSRKISRDDDERYAAFYEAIPAALLLYRLICTFGPT